MLTSGAFQVIVSVSSMFPASISSLPVPVSVAGAIAVFVLVTAITTLAAVAVVAVARRSFDITGGGGIEERLDIES